MTVSTEQLDALRLQYGQVWVASPNENPDTEVVYRKASRIEARAYYTDRDSDAYKYLAAERLVSACVVYPPRHDLEALLDANAFFAGPLAGAIMMASGGGDARSKKA